jgi:hypothetical protein
MPEQKKFKIDTNKIRNIDIVNNQQKIQKLIALLKEKKKL